MNLGAAFGTMVARGVVLTAGLATGVITARALGPEGRGQYFAVTTFSAIAAQIGNLGMTSSNVFLAARDSRAIWPVFINGAWLSLGLAIALAVGLAIVGPRIAAAVALPEYLLWAVSMLAPALLFFTLSCSVLIAEERFTAVNAWQVANALLTTILLGSVAFMGQPVGWFVYATTCSALVAVIGLAVFASAGRIGALKFRSDVFAAGWRFASRAYVVLLLGFLMQRASVGILMMHSDAAQLGLYSIASQIFDVLVIIPSSIAMVIFPGLVKRPDGQWASIRGPLLATTGAMVFLCAMVAVVAEPVIALVFGEAFAPASSVVAPLLPAIVFTTATTVLSQLVVSRQFPRALVVIWSLGLALMVVAAVFLAPRYGAAGVSAAQSLGSALVCAGVITIARKQIASQGA